MELTEKEIEQMALEYSNTGKDAGLTHKEYTLEKIAFIKGFQSCQELQEKESWISVDDRLPETETNVLVLYRDTLIIALIQWEYPSHEESFNPYPYWTNEDESWVDDTHEVSHWQPLPQPPIQTI